MAYTLGQAAKAAGRSKTTIHRAITSGRLSASRTDTGDYSIDPAELARVFPTDRSGNGAMERSVTDERLSAAQAERDRYRDIAEERLETIRDLRSRLDASEGERRRVQAQLTGLLTDGRSGETTVQPWPRRVLSWLVKQHV
jgi:hypothetical protein